jgi:hypothetical protein
MTKDDEKATDEMNPRSTWEFVQVDTESNAESNDYGFFERRDANESLRGGKDSFAHSCRRFLFLNLFTIPLSFERFS